MADLKTNYVDDKLDTSKNQLRKYQMIQNDDGTVSLVDVTEYLTQGTNFGAKDINDTNTAINDLNNSLQATDIAITTPTNSTWKATWQAKKIGNIVIATGNFTLNYTSGQGSGYKWSTSASGINPSMSIFASSSCGIDYPVSIEWQNDGKINITNRGSKTIPNSSTFQVTFCVPIV